MAGEAEWTWARQWLGGCSKSSRTSDRLPQEAAPLTHSYKCHRRTDPETVADPPAPPVGALPSSELTRVEAQRPSVFICPTPTSWQVLGAWPELDIGLAFYSKDP